MRTRPLPLLATVLVAILAIGLGVALASASPASAHTEVQRATPSPGEVVAGPVDSVELLFLDPVLPSVTITVRSSDGDAVDDLGTVTHTDDGRGASVAFAPISAPGDYVVDYEFVAIDGDAQTDAFRFTVEPSASDDGAGAIGLVPVAVVVVGLGLAVAIALRRRATQT